MPIITVDLEKFTEELERMELGEIPFDPDYLSELVEHDGPEDTTIRIEVTAHCFECGEELQPHNCPDCNGLKVRADHSPCPACKGRGQVLQCSYCEDYPAYF